MRVRGQWRRFCLPAVMFLLLGALACDSSPHPTSQRAQRESQSLVAPPAKLPNFTLAAGLREEHPDASAFVDEFLQTCLAGDYAGYRRFVSRYVTPESRERFTAIYHAVRAVRVESIKPIDAPRVSAGTSYLINCQVEFDPDSPVRRRHLDPELAILVFKEEGQWRMRPAPASMQPRKPAATEPASQPAASAPAYPWDEDVDS